VSLSRREMLGTAVRWTVPTVVTMTLGARVLEAKASCPPCQKKVSTVCRACTISQMLNCQCEPCLGPPYCSAVGPVAPANLQSRQQAPGSQPFPSTPGMQGRTPGNPSPYGLTPYQQQELQRQRALRSRDPFKQPLYRDPFGADRAIPTPGLYDRLRSDTLRRQP